MADRAEDPYLDPATGRLRTLLPAGTRDDLDAAEADLVATRMAEDLLSAVPPTSDLQELRAIHRHLFQDVYAWAGELRTVDVRKDVPGAGYFFPWQDITQAMEFVSRQLEEEEPWDAASHAVVHVRLAHFYELVNFIHPFREGNGRVQRIFIDRLAQDSGWTIDWSGVSRKENDEACRTASDRSDMAPLNRMFRRIVSRSAPSGSARRVGLADQ